MKHFKTQDFSYKDRQSLSKSDDILGGGGMLIGGMIDMGSANNGMGQNERHPIFSLHGNNSTDGGTGPIGPTFGFGTHENTQDIFSLANGGPNHGKRGVHDNGRFKD